MLTLCFRWGLFVLSIAVSAWVVYVELSQARMATTQKIGSITFSDPVKAALENKLATSRSLSQAGLVVLGVLWGLMIGKKDEVRIIFGDWPETLMFLFANVMVIASLVFGYLHAERITDACASGFEKKNDATAVIPPATKDEEKVYSIPDLFGPRIDYLYVLQSFALMGGVILCGFTFFSAHRLKDNPP